MKYVIFSAAAVGLFAGMAFGASDESASKDMTLSPGPATMASPTTTEAAPKTGAEEAKSEELLKAAQNPVANLISVPFQNNFNFGAGEDGNQCIYVLNFQPVIPIELSEDWNLITRTILPIINQPSLGEGLDSSFGIGDLNPTFFFSPAKSEKLIWGVGPTFTFPTGTPGNPGLTSGMYSAGIAGVVLRMDGPWVYGVLANQQWSYSGWGPQEYNQTLIQPFVNYNLPDRWYLVTAPIITANWAQASDYQNVWTLPIGAGIGKLVHFGKLPVNLQLAAYYNALTPDNGATWQLRFQFQFLFPAKM